MRISTGMVFTTGLNSIQKQTATLLHTQQQVASGRRILTPADDPVAAARALEVDQARLLNQQYQTNQQTSSEALGREENALVAVGDLIRNVRTLAVQGGGGALSDSDRRSIATELRQRFDELLGYANATDGTGEYLFSGYMGNTQPFSGTVATGVAYSGDDGQRLQQVSLARQVAVSDSGNELFMRIRNGNGSFVTTADAGNGGAGIIDAGSVTDPVRWNDAANSRDFTVVFAVDDSVSPPLTTYDIVDNASGDSLLTGAPPGGAPLPRSFTPGQAIVLASQGAEPPFDFGAQWTIKGQPADGDTFAITASTSQSLFTTLADLIGALEAPSNGGASNALLANRIGSALTNFDQAEGKLLSVRATIGARMNEIDSLANAGEDLNLNYEQTLSRLQDVDFAEALTRLNQQQVYLEAAQKSFMNVSGLSLFNYV